MKKGKESLLQMGVIPNRLTCGLLTKEFFSERPNVYQKVLVKLESANVNDTISFSYNGRQYIREIHSRDRPSWKGLVRDGFCC